MEEFERLRDTTGTLHPTYVACFIYSEESAGVLHVNLQVGLCVEARLHRRPNNRGTPNNRYELLTLGDESEALL